MISSDLVAALFADSPVGVAVTVGAEHRIAYVNQRFAERFGPRALLGRTVRDALPELADQGLCAILDAVLSGARPGRPPSVHLRAPDRDRALRVVTFLQQPISFEGQPGLLCFTFDERAPGEEALRARVARGSERLRALAVAALEISQQPELDDALAATAQAARDIVGAEHAATCIVRDGAAAATSASPPGEGAAAATALHGLVCERNQPVRLSRDELVAHGSGGGHAPRRGWLAAPLIDPSGANLGLLELSDKLEGDFDDDDLAVVRQLAQLASAAIDKARLLEQARAAQSRAEEASRLKDDFLAAVSHELRTPLNAISGWAQLLSSEEVSAQEQSRAHQVILRNAKALGELVDDLIDVSRIVSGKLRLRVGPVDLADLAESVVTSLKPAARAKRIRLDTALDDSAPLIAGDEDRLRQVVNNLMTNAIKFTPAEGAVGVTLRQLDGSVELAITDSGEGIAPEMLESVFERFRQAEGGTARRHGGLGLGLAIARDLIELHGGTVSAESDGVGHGTTMRVLLPVAATPRRGDTLPPPLAADRIHDATFRDVQVLVVDDEEDARSLIETLLGGHGARVVSAASAREALARLDARSFDVLISDLHLPEMDGFELIRRVRARPVARGGHVPAIAVSAYAQVEDRTRALLEGFDLHVAKPVEVGELIAVVHAAVTRYQRSGGGGSEPE